MSEESKITLRDGTVIKVTGGGNKDNASVSVYTGDYRDPDNHSAIHINVNTKTGKGSIVEHGENHSNNQKTDTQCYLTTACMRHFQENFDDNCEELNILRWFRDKFVSKEDIKNYYIVAPIIVEEIEKLENNDEIYNYIYKKVVRASVQAIKRKDYAFAYTRYKSSVKALEETFAKPVIRKKFVKELKMMSQSKY